MLMNVIGLCVIGVVAVSCKDMAGKDVSWFSLIKLPSSATPSKGQEFMYIDPENLQPSVQSKLINEQTAIAYTLTQIDNKTVSSLMFNDQPPTLSDEYSGSKHFLRLQSSLAHSKGVIMYDSNNAIYIIHSIPHFPAIAANGKVNSTINNSQLVYGQNMMCVTLSTKELFSLVGVMTLIQPSVFYKNIVLQNSNITSLINDVALDIGKIASYSFFSGGISWNYIAKSQYSNLDLWDNVVSAFYKSGLEVQSWGRPYMPSVCPPNNVYSVLNIFYLKIQSYSWKNTQDHSKWAVVDEEAVTCYGDMNRMTSQRTRGGGALCTSFPASYKIHRGIITDVEPCNT